ncbi:MAG: oxidoreductase [Phycisphaeraceae bacterium]|nr:oxidoreductase [Phycisphaeraceae bacterium]
MASGRVVVGMVGARFAARFHLANYRRVVGLDVEIGGVTSKQVESARSFAEQHGITRVYRCYEELLADPQIDLVDLCVPNSLHAPMAIQAARAGKHVLCEKPLTGYFGAEGDAEPIGRTVSRRTMLEGAARSADAVIEAVCEAGTILCYAQCWVYAPGVTKVNELLSQSDTTILRIVGEVAHSGSHSPYAKQWNSSGGGSLFNKGCHPLSVALHLKAQEGERRGVGPIRPRSVVASVANLTEVERFRDESPKWIQQGWDDCEDWGAMLVTFDDGTVAQISAADMTLGGIHSVVTVYASKAVLQCNINPNTGVLCYAPAPEVFGDAYLREKVETKAGWQFTNPDEDWANGFPAQMQDFCEAVASGREPLCGGALARDIVITGYGAYLSAETGQRVDLEPWR